MKTLRVLVTALLVVALGVGLPLLQTPTRAQQSSGSTDLGIRDAIDYNFTPMRIFAGPIAAGSPATFQLTNAQVKLTDGRTIVPWFIGEHVKIGTGSQQESVTLTAVSGCFNGAPQGNCTISGNTSNQHGQGDLVASGTVGAEEAMYDGYINGGSLVAVGSFWAQAGGTTAMLAAAPVFPKVSFMDVTQGSAQYWNAVAGATTLAAPTTLIAATAGFGVNGANFTGGAYTGNNTYITCISYVDIMGQEGPCSATFTVATSGVATTDQIGYTAPAASPGAVGYTIYITLNGGAYNLSYKVPLVTQPSVVGTYPVGNGVCTLTTVELVTPACAVANTTYSQTGVGAVVSALTLNTSPINPESTIISTTSVYVPQAGGRTTYTYAPGGIVGPSGIPGNWLAFPLTAAAATVVPAVLGTINLPPNFMNVLGKKIEVCGEATGTATAATITDIQIQWDSMGQNTAGKGVLIGDFTDTTSSAMATTGHITFCEDFAVTVTSATATGGSINHVGGYMGAAGLTVAGSGGGGDTVTPGAIGSLNLAVDSRINIIYLHTTATDGAGWILQSASVQLK